MANLAPPEFIGQEWGGQRGIDNFLKGFSLMASLSARRHQSEIALAKLQQQTELSQMKHEVDVARLDQQGQHNADVADHYRMDAEIADRRYKELDERERFRQGRTVEQVDAGKKLMEDVSSITAKKHSQEWRDAVGDALLSNPDAAASAQYKELQQVLKKENNPTFRTQQQTFNTRVQDLGIQSYDVFENPDVWRTDPTKPGKVYVQQGFKADKVTPNFVTIDKNTKDNLQSMYREMYGDPTTGRPAPKLTKQLDADTVKKVSTEIKARSPGISTDDLKTGVRKWAQDNGYEY